MSALQCTPLQLNDSRRITDATEYKESSQIRETCRSLRLLKPYCDDILQVLHVMEACSR